MAMNNDVTMIWPPERGLTIEPGKTMKRVPGGYRRCEPS
jgi:hypothetical protein